MHHKKPPNNRRKHPRVPLNLLVQVRSKDYDEFLHDVASNLSMGGMFLCTDQPKPEGALLYFQFTTDADGPLIEGLARVVRVVETGGGHPAGMGLEFVNVEEPSLQRIEEIVNERLARGS